MQSQDEAVDNLGDEQPGPQKAQPHVSSTNMPFKTGSLSPDALCTTHGWESSFSSSPAVMSRPVISTDALV